jgi:tetratricopeptide (TPR) repeat protein
MRYNRVLFWLVLLVATAGGCAGLGKKSSDLGKKSLELGKKPLDKIFNREQGKLLQTYLEKGQDYEQKGDLKEALKQYRLALAVSPKNQQAIEGRDKLTTTLRAMAERHYQSGLRFHKRGKYALARAQFLTALRLWPDHLPAKKMLAAREQVRAERYVVHKIQPGETLAQLAKVYYGDYHQFCVIAEYNNLTDATRVKVGQDIKVPEIDGLPFLTAKKEIETAEKKVPGMVAAGEEAEEMAPSGEETHEETAEESEEACPEAEEEPEPVVDVVAMYRDQGIGLFNQKEYQEAIVEFTKAVNVDPEDSIALEYLYKSHFEQAVMLFDKEDYLSAKKEFEACLRYKEDSQQCHEYAAKSEQMYKDLHYNRGVSYFGKEQLSEAIKEWELVQAVDPGYKQIEDNINKAKALLKRLEEIKKAQEQG